ncbi:hypothetical protein DFQ27_004833 [Actinomortierella ambigua]|uniref:Uncharacterized protein n=1 Tax=Actinomortierella ambigua TaxID=1343610 RepID=A0A9P6QM95_9FUNG|nr:hypothetical protein DFQ27_004833 [Actinomortierella ambigua]
MVAFYEASKDDDLFENKRARRQLESLEKKVLAIAAEKHDGAAIFGLPAKERHELYALQQSASWTVFEAMLWILCRSGFVYRSAQLITWLYQTAFQPKGEQGEVELLLMSPLFRPFLKVTAYNGVLCFRLDPTRIQATLRASDLGAADISFPPLLPGVRDMDQFAHETNPDSWVYVIQPLVRSAMLAKASGGLQAGFPYTGMLLPSVHNFSGDLVDLNKRVPLWDALLIVLDLVDTMPAGNWERKHALLEIYISVAKAIGGTFDKIMTDLQEDDATMSRLASARTQSTYHLSQLATTTSANAMGDAFETTAVVPISISVYDDVDDAGSDITDSDDSDVDDLRGTESPEAKPDIAGEQDEDGDWDDETQDTARDWMQNRGRSRIKEEEHHRDRDPYSEYAHARDRGRELHREGGDSGIYGYLGRSQSRSPQRYRRDDGRQ